MPAWVKDEARWSRAKAAAAKSKGKSVESLHDDDFALANYIYHKMGKTEEDVKRSDELKKGLLGGLGGGFGMAGGGMGLGLTGKSGMGGIKITQTNVKLPKPKKPVGAMSKPSLFYKTEGCDDLKHPTLLKFRDFFDKKHKS